MYVREGFGFEFIEGRRISFTCKPNNLPSQTPIKTLR